ncbi:MAG TPA: ABC transporter permease [Steroidobacteraceae bacterium]|nr:ABC transporter permease [Steroidobacteraceae bacterium]
MSMTLSASLAAPIACLGVVSACLLGIGLALERPQSRLDLGRAAPLPRVAALGAKTVTCAAFGLIIASALMASATAFGGISIAGAQAATVAGVVLGGAIPFAAMGFLIALLIAPGAGPVILHLLALPLSLASGFGMPVRDLPQWLEALTRAPPAGHFAQLALAAFGLAPAGGPGLHWAVHGACALLLVAAGSINFPRREANAR